MTSIKIDYAKNGSCRNGAKLKMIHVKSCRSGLIQLYPVTTEVFCIIYNYYIFYNKKIVILFI
jgi:hypothetical protein